MTTAVAIRDNRGLTDERIARACPSVFATQPHESRSEKYFQIPTRDILAAMRAEGFFPTEVTQSGSRIEGKEAYTKHLLRLRRVADLGLGKDVHEVVLVNSHDGTSSYQLMSGIFRLVCTNGLVTGDINHRISIRHQGRAEDLARVVEATYRIVEEGDRLLEVVEDMKGITLTREEQLLFAKYAMLARFGQLPAPVAASANVVDAVPSVPASPAPTIYEPADFLRVRRMEDQSPDLYTTTNVIQENVTRGGVRRYVGRERHSTRPIKGIDQSLKLNQLVWAFAEELRKLHQGK